MKLVASVWITVFRRLSAAVLTVFFVSGIGACASAVPESEEPATQVAAIAFWRDQRLDDTAIVRTDSVVPSFLVATTGEELESFAPDASPETLESFRVRAAVSAPLTDDAFPQGCVISTVPDPAPQENAPVIGVSRAGLGFDEAVVYIDIVCGEGCAETHVVFLRRDGEGWKAVSSKRVSVA